MARHHVGAVEDLFTDGGDGDGALSPATIVEARGLSIGLFLIDGEIHALLNHCPHQGGPLCEGIVMPALRAKIEGPGRVREYFDDATPVAACPWHGLEVSIKTGAVLAQPRWSVRTYPATVENGQVYLEV